MGERAAEQPPLISGFGYVRPLGSGGFARVYLYEQDMPRRVVAVKVLEEDLSTPTDRSVFEAEADTMARLSSHPSIVSIFQASVSSDGRPYLAMEYCPDSMRARTKGRPAPVAEVLDAGVRLAGALETAHQAGVLHRDIKPSNVLISTTGRPALADFGIASLRGRVHGEGASQAMSIPWAAPEIITGEASGTIASEVWSLGATLYTFAAGRSPFESGDRVQNTQAKMSARIEKARYAPLSASPGYEALDAVLARAMSRSPRDRFPSMREFGLALQQLQRHYGLDVTPLDVVSAGWVTPAAHDDRVRGPVVSSVQRSSRAQKRADHLARDRGTDRDGLVIDAPGPSPLRAGLIGAGIAVAAIGAIALAVLVLGGGL
ncbi:serine/threonine protein kinase [Leucobacter sp. CSA1]|uniref:non-specific serine/threonine protein kinase n=1 Tax=Leucobacter chromiisoli TaxID=2796471 RepID=A0A934Q4U7_9MICO|nr:serine/threonine-protein kinase [Leucobacter chromiisoli]MBK0417596.1 serine/threonine protein kinase [Leucobacter chromiisoli]